MMIAGVTAVLLLGLSWLAKGVISGPAEKPDTVAGCWDYYADIRAYMVGRMCWTATTATVACLFDNRTGPGLATAQLCLSNVQHNCVQTLDLAVADPGQTTHVERTVELPLATERGSVPVSPAFAVKGSDRSRRAGTAI